MSTYAWIITKDHLAENADEDEVGTFGPRDARFDQIGALKGGKGDTFRMYDDDGELYYTGRCIADDPNTEEACYGPLGDYGMPNAGCTEIRWPGHPDRDCN